jgi:hypothetical protein
LTWYLSVFIPVRQVMHSTTAAKFQPRSRPAARLPLGLGQLPATAPAQTGLRQPRAAKWSEALWQVAATPRSLPSVGDHCHGSGVCLVASRERVGLSILIGGARPGETCSSPARAANRTPARAATKRPRPPPAPRSPKVSPPSAAGLRPPPRSSCARVFSSRRAQTSRLGGLPAGHEGHLRRSPFWS